MTTFAPSVLFVPCVMLLCAVASAAEAPATNDYAAVDAIFSKYCMDCHAAQDPEAKLVLENFDSLMKGSENGPVIVPGKSGESLLVRMVEGTVEKDGKKLIMPPGKKRAKLQASEIAVIKSWIAAGAPAPAMTKAIVTELDVPKIPVKGTPRNPINALAHVPGTNLIAVARYREVELCSDQTGELKRTLSGHHGNVNGLAFSPDGQHLFAGSGENVRFGEIKEWNVADGALLRTFLGHKDTVYAVAVSPDGKILASGSYDQKIKLWDIATGRELKTLSGHNGCIFGLAFRPDGKILASASSDHTVKLWDVASGARRDTLSQPLKDVFAVAFSPDGVRLAAAGADNRIRIWQISPSAAETTNPLLDSDFAAEGAILRLVFSPDGKMLLSSADDRTVRLWDAATMHERVLLEKQPDWAAGLDFTRDSKAIAVGRLDGTLGFYDLAGKSLALASDSPKKSEKMKAAPPPSDKPAITRVEPHGMQRGTELTVKVVGANLLGLTAVKSGNPKLSVSFANAAMSTATEIWLKIKAAADLPRGAYDISLANEKGESSPVKLYVGHLPHVFESETNKPGTARFVSWPLSYWGTLNPGGDIDELEFRAQSGQTLVFDLAGKSIGSKAEANLDLLDPNGHILASQGEFEGGDPLLAHTFASNGTYRIRITEVTDEGSPDFYYRLTMGELPEVVSVFPPSLQTNSTAEVQLVGFNLAGKDKVWIKPTKAGELDVRLDSDKYRTRHPFKVLVTDDPVIVETEPNDTPAQANPIPVPCTVCGRIFPTATADTDADLYRFEAKAGQKLILETDAARLGSPIDTKIEVLYATGTPVERLQLRAVRDSAINFREIDSASTEVRIDNWQEMELNQYLYMQGEVCRLFRAPQGPDSGFAFYSSAGKRRDYFDTSATDHALDEPCYIVEPHPPGEKLQANGLPVFPLYYVNDDDGDRQLGTDSRLHFTAPANGSYLIRVTDNRGRGGPRFFYRLIVREARPDFAVTLNGATPTISPGAGSEFSLTTDRIDNFDEDIRIDITGVPAGFRVSTPIVIQAGHSEAKGTINCDTNAMAPKADDIAKIKVTATALVEGREVMKSVNPFTAISLGAAATLLVECEPYEATATNFVWRPVAAKPVEITLAPGQIVPAWIKVARRGHDDLITFTAENLPHGVIIDNIGLNGVLIPKEESRRQIFLHSEKWVPDIDRLFYIKAAQAGEPTSLPVLLHLRRSALNQTASAMK
jgi:WD40 repeat protein